MGFGKSVDLKDNKRKLNRIWRLINFGSDGERTDEDGSWVLGLGNGHLMSCSTWGKYLSAEEYLQ